MSSSNANLGLIRDTCNVYFFFQKSDINAHAKEAGQTALMLAVSHGRIQTAQLLLNSGAEINARDEDGSTALMCAVEHNQLEAVKLLLSKPNCDPTIADAVNEVKCCIFFARI